MDNYIGDFKVGQDIEIYFDTCDKNGGKISPTIVSDDILIYRNGVFICLVDPDELVLDFQTYIGVHRIILNVLDHAEYAAGYDFSVILKDSTIDGETVTAVLATFSIENRYQLPEAGLLAYQRCVKGTVDNTAHAPTTTEFEADDITEATADHYKGRSILFCTGVLTDQGTSITGYSLVGGRGHFTVVAMTEPPGNDDIFVIV